MDTIKAVNAPPLKTYSLKLQLDHIEHLKHNEQGLPPSTYLRSLVIADMQGVSYVETV